MSSTLIIGATGLVGRLISAGLIKSTHKKLVLLVRTHHSRESVLKELADELVCMGSSAQLSILNDLEILPLPPINKLHNLLPVLKTLDISEIIHSAGSMEYHNVKHLQEVNIDLTNKLLELGKALDIQRFVYISTAFSCGFTSGLIPERLHPEPLSDPTPYTSTKRQAEWLVSKSSLPFLIVRPGIIIGDSRSGRYSGKPFGLYQFWGAAEKFLHDRYRPVLHMVAPQSHLQVIHQDAFLAGFMAAYQELPLNSIIHLVSRARTLPIARQVYELWIKQYLKPEELYYYDKVSDAPKEVLDRRLKLWLEFTAINTNIASHTWDFETTTLSALRNKGLDFTDATLDTIKICQDTFARNSKPIQNFLARHQVDQAPLTKIVDLSNPIPSTALS